MKHVLPTIKLLTRTIRALLLKDRPYFATFYVTSRCNFKCRMCNVWKRQSKDMAFDEICQAIDKLDKLGVSMLQLTGGEPFLRKDLLNIIRYAASKGMVVGIVTNGSGKVETYKKLREVPIEYVGVSLHSHEAGVQDRICGRAGGWQKAVRTLLLLKKFGIPTSINCTINRMNIHRLEETLSFFSSFDVGVGLIPLVKRRSHFRSGALACKIKKGDAERVFSLIKEAGLNAHFLRSDQFTKKMYCCITGNTPKWGCLAGTFFCSVASDGEFALCHDISSGLNLLDPHFEEKYFSKRTREDITAKREQCRGCMYSCYYDLQMAFEKPLEGLFTLMRFRRALYAYTHKLKHRPH